MEILRAKRNTISYTLPDNEAVVSTAAWFFNGQTGSLAVSNPVDGVVTITLPYFEFDGTVAVVLNLSGLAPQVVTETLYYDIVTPILSVPEILKIIEDIDDFTEEDALALERFARLIIQSHTHQTFGKFKKTLAAESAGPNAFKLPEKLISAGSINDSAFSAGWFRITGGGWYLETTQSHTVPPIKADFDGINIATTNYVSQVPISFTPPFMNDPKVYITGIWGWNSPPEPVREAARILIKSIVSDSTYRERYLSSVSAADWKIQFHSNAFAKTGNARADQLLAPYVVMRGWGVI